MNASLASVSRWRWRRPQSRDEPLDVGEQLPGNCDLGHLESGISAVAENPRADLDERQRGSRRFTRRLRHRRLAPSRITC